MAPPGSPLNGSYERYQQGRGRQQAARGSRSVSNGHHTRRQQWGSSCPSSSTTLLNLALDTDLALLMSIHHTGQISAVDSRTKTLSPRASFGILGTQRGVWCFWSCCSGCVTLFTSCIQDMTPYARASILFAYTSGDYCQLHTLVQSLLLPIILSTGLVLPAASFWDFEALRCQMNSLYQALYNWVGLRQFKNVLNIWH